MNLLGGCSWRLHGSSPPHHCHWSRPKHRSSGLLFNVSLNSPMDLSKSFLQLWAPSVHILITCLPRRTLVLARLQQVNSTISPFHFFCLPSAFRLPSTANKTWHWSKDCWEFSDSLNESITHGVKSAVGGGHRNKSQMRLLWSSESMDGRWCKMKSRPMKTEKCG